MSYGAKVDGYAPFEHSKELYSVLQLATLRVWGTDTRLVDVFLENGTSPYGSLVTLIENLSEWINTTPMYLFYIPVCSFKKIC